MRSERQALAELADELNGMMDSLEEDTPHHAIYEQLRERWREVQQVLADVQAEPAPAGVFLSPTEAEAVVRWYTGDLRDMETPEEMALVRRLEDAGIASASAPEPAPAGGTIDPSVLHDVLEGFVEEALSSGFWDLWAMVEAVLATVRPGGTIDRKVLEDLWDNGNATGLDGWIGPGRGAGDVDPEAVLARTRDVDQALALVRPASGVVLTLEEAGTALDIARAHLGHQGGRLSDIGFRGRVEALAKRLEAGS